LPAEAVGTRERGRRTFVRPPAIEQPTGAIYSLFRSIDAQGREQRSTGLGLAKATDAVLGSGGPFAERLRRHKLFDRPTAVRIGSTLATSSPNDFVMNENVGPSRRGSIGGGHGANTCGPPWTRRPHLGRQVRHRSRSTRDLRHCRP